MLARWLSPHADKVYAALRMVAGLLFSLHGLQKIFGFLAERPQPVVGSQHWIGGLIELVGGTLVFLGLLTRPAAFIASGTMAVAYVQFHWKGQFDQNFSPLLNGGELALLFSFVFLFIACQGPGRCSLDRLLQRGTTSDPRPHRS